MNNLLAVLIVLGVQLGAHSTAVLCGATQPQAQAQVQARAQDADGPAVAPPISEPERLGASESAPDTAHELLDKAARFQRGDTPRGRPLGLHGLFQVHVRNLADDSSIDARVERTYLRDPVRMVTTREDHLVNSNSTVGFDGEHTWFRDNATGKVIVYSDDPLTFDVDLEQMRAQLQLMPVMLDAFVIDALVPRLQGVRMEGGVVAMQIGSRGSKTADVQWVVGRLEDELFDPEPGPPPMPGANQPAPPELQVRLAIEPTTGKLWAFGVTTLGRSTQRQLELRFLFHRASPSGLMVPARTAVYQDGEADPFITLGMIEDPDGELILDLDPVVDVAVFAVPK